MIGRRIVLLTVGLALYACGVRAWHDSAIVTPRREQELAAAVWRGDLPTATRLLDQGVQFYRHVEPPAPGLDYAFACSPWSIAIVSGQPAMVRLLLERGADPNRPLVGGSSPAPLIYAAGKGDLALAQVLLEAGASPNAPTCFQVTAITVATDREDTAMLHLLERWEGARPADDG
jgi:ankyrin repeat protein